MFSYDKINNKASKPSVSTTPLMYSLFIAALTMRSLYVYFPGLRWSKSIIKDLFKDKNEMMKSSI